MSDPSLTERKPGMNGWTMAIVGSVAFIVFVALFYWIWSIRWDRQFAAQIQEIRDRGEPVTQAELEEFYCLPNDAVDTTALWMAGMKELGGLDYEKEARPFPFVNEFKNSVPGVGESWVQLELVEQFLGRHRDQIDLMHAAARQGGAARFPSTEVGLNSAVTVLMLGRGHRLLRLDARVQSHRGRTAEVAQCLSSMFRCGESLEREPLLISLQQRILLDISTVNDTAVALSDVEFTGEQLASLQKMFREVDLTEGYQRAIIGERCAIVDLYAKFFSGQGGKAPMTAEDMWTKVVKQDTATYFETMEETIGVCDDSFSDTVAKLDAHEQLARKLTGPRHRLSRMGGTLYAPFLKKKAMAESYLRMADLGIAIARYRLANSRLPDSPKDCVPKFIPSLPVDPYSDAEIHFDTPDTKGKAFVLYCVGENGLDDGGREAGDADVVFRVGKPW